MDTLTIVLAATAGFLLLVALVLYQRVRKLRATLIVAARRIGAKGTRKRPRPVDDLANGLDQVEGYIAYAQRDRAQLLGALEAADVGIMVVDDVGVVTFVNGVAQRYLGARHGEAVGEVRLRQVLDEVIVTQRPAEQELDLYSPVRRVLRLRAVPIEHGVESLGAVLFIQDLTEQRRLEAIRRDFVANVGHELKTPLGALSILAETLVDTDDPVVRARLAERVTVESARMAGLVDDLLGLAEVESFGAPSEPIEIEPVVKEAVGQLKAGARERGVEIVVDPVPENTVVAGDRRQLVSAVANLLDNAVKYSDPVDDGTPKVWIRVLVDEAWVSIEVEDEGIGIPQSHMDRIFERFYRVDRGRSQTTGGTGLGLSIVRHVALNHRGEVAVNSEEGKGSTFVLRLPRLPGS